MLQCFYCQRKAMNNQGMAAHVRSAHTEKYADYLARKNRERKSAKQQEEDPPVKQELKKKPVGKATKVNSVPSQEQKVIETLAVEEVVSAVKSENVKEAFPELTPEEHLREALALLQNRQHEIDDELARLQELEKERNINQSRIDALTQAIEVSYPANGQQTPAQIAHHGFPMGHSNVPYHGPEHS